MKEIQVTYYVAEDGLRFEKKEDCYNHECMLKKYKEFFRTLTAIKEMCYNLGDCQDCPFSNGEFCGITFTDVTENTENRPFNWDFEKWEGFR